MMRTAIDKRRAFRLPILMYHHVGRALHGANPQLTVTPSDFARQMRWLIDHGYRTVSDLQVADCYSKGESLPARSVLLTFDDAYRDLAEYVFPLLKHAQLKATVYVVTSRIGERSTWDAPTYTPYPLLTEEQIRI